jgi:hypothetical protein
MMSGKRQHYRSYLLRLWQAGNAKESIWRASLEDVRSGERCGFADLSSLFAFLEEQARGYPERDKDHEPIDEG